MTPTTNLSDQQGEGPFIADSGRAYRFWMRPCGADVHGIIAAVADRHGLTVEELCGPSRCYRIAHPRQEAMWELRRRTRLSLPQIARRLNRADHTPVMHGIRAHERRIAEAGA
jgi:chromosomal replication initiation ATPase DnaA